MRGLPRRGRWVAAVEDDSAVSDDAQHAAVEGGGDESPQAALMAFERGRMNNMRCSISGVTAVWSRGAGVRQAGDGFPLTQRKTPCLNARTPLLWPFLPVVDVKRAGKGGDVESPRSDSIPTQQSLFRGWACNT